MKITVKVWLQGDEDSPGRPVLIVAPDMYAYEKTFNVAITEAFTRENPRMSDQYWLSWHSMHRSGRFDGDFETFMGQLLAVDDLEVGSFGPKPAENDAPAEAAADPTQPDGQPGASPTSPIAADTASVT